MPENVINPSRKIVLVLYVLANIVIALKSGEPTQIWWWLGEIFFLAWIISPIAFLCISKMAPTFFTVGAVIIGMWGIITYWQDMFGPGARSTSALILLFLPIYQWAAVGVLALIAYLFSEEMGGENER
ncbi:hypothetical protein [Altererythrobacter sp. ZODW24]|uniref:hypothetical protein n=1 Tax=Altererythrobacter sp. ZODW24 TaxID=2185142 RepID=UPI000DF79A7E|nr:hypothetical protein [Altererythrobacter sp. ZODW24]